MAKTGPRQRAGAHPAGAAAVPMPWRTCRRPSAPRSTTTPAIRRRRTTTIARMHVAVAPACNIQCHYCNRKYDCSNESPPRRGLAKLLTPDQAVKKVMAVAANIPQMTVLGIAGPGDPLANPERTFETFRQLLAEGARTSSCACPPTAWRCRTRWTSCASTTSTTSPSPSTGGPGRGRQDLPLDLLEQQAPDQGPRGRRDPHRAAAEGPGDADRRGILVKVNSVMIPGVNDEHLMEVNRVVKAKGRLPAQRHAADLRGRARHLLRPHRPARPDPRGTADPAGRLRGRHEPDAPLPPVPRRCGGPAGRGPRRRIHPRQDRVHGDRLRQGHGEAPPGPRHHRGQSRGTAQEERRDLHLHCQPQGTEGGRPARC